MFPELTHVQFYSECVYSFMLILKYFFLLTVELHNSQVIVKGCETPGHVIVSAANAQVLSCNHVPIWKDNQLRSKTTWVGSVECMQVGSFILDFITVKVTF